MTKKMTEAPAFVLPGVEDIMRRDFLVGGAGLLLLGGCGGNGEGGSPPGETRAVEHALGGTEVPVSPQRTVVVDAEATLSSLLALGVEPVAAATYGFTAREFPNVPPGFDEKIEDLEALDISSEEIDLESLAALEPGLIIGYAPSVKGVYKELSRIAPTVATPTHSTDVRPLLRFAGRVFGMEDKAGKLIEDHERRVEAASEKLGDPGTVSAASIFPGDVRVYGRACGRLRWRRR